MVNIRLAESNDVNVLHIIQYIQNSSRTHRYERTICEVFKKSLSVTKCH